MYSDLFKIDALAFELPRFLQVRFHCFIRRVWPRQVARHQPRLLRQSLVFLSPPSTFPIITVVVCSQFQTYIPSFTEFEIYVRFVFLVLNFFVAVNTSIFHSSRRKWIKKCELLKCLCFSVHVCARIASLLASWLVARTEVDDVTPAILASVQQWVFLKDRRYIFDFRYQQFVWKAACVKIVTGSSFNRHETLIQPKTPLFI